MTDDTGVGSKHDQGTVWRRLSPGVVTGVYTAVGIVWIVLSDLFFAALGVDGLDVDISVAKGIGYVVVTGLLLFEVLRRRERWLTAARQELTRWVIEEPPLALDQLRVLVVDDDPDDREFLREALAHAVGPRLVVEEVATLATAREAILDRAHDIYLVDQRLPGGSGLDLIREFHEVASGPMILITGTDDLDTDMAALQSGAHDYLLKHEIQPSWIGRTIRYAVANWRSRRELARTKQWYSEMVTETPIGLFRSRPDGTLNEANPALVEMFGARDVDQLRAVGVHALYRDPAIRPRLIDRVAAGETIEDELVPMRRIDGTPIDVRIRMRGIRSEEGLIALYGALIDVTDEVHNVRRVAIQASMLDQVENAVVRTGLDGSILYWNRAAEETYGWSADEVIGRPAREVTPAPQESDRIEPLVRQLDAEGFWAGEFLCRRKDGTTFPAYVSIGALHDPDGKQAGYVGVTVDLTDLRRAEARAATQEAMAASVLESVRFPACVLDETGTIIAVNGAWTGTAIANNADLAAVGPGVSYLDVCDRASGDDARIVADGMRRVLRAEVASFSHEYPCGGEWFRLEVARAAEPLGGAVAMHIDITELRAAAKQAEEFARSKDRLIASVSHELRTPLTAVLGFADLIEHPDVLAPEEVAVFASEIHRQATDMAAIVEDLLVAARAQMGALAVQMQSTDVTREVAEVVRHMAHRPEVIIETRLAPVPPTLADPLRIRQILRNLINNAARYGGGRVVVETRSDDAGVHVRVLDDGAGVPEQHREAIFQPFFSAHDRAGQPDSLGLGLSVVRTLAESMEGSVRVDREGNWTVFDLTLQAAGQH